MILAESWDAHCMALDRRQGIVLSSVTGVLTPLGIWASARMNHGPPPIPWAWCALLDLVFLGAVAAFLRARTPLQVRWATVAVHLVICAVVAWIAPVTNPHWVIVLVASFLVWGPHAAFLWPTEVALPMFGIVPVAFLASHMLRGHEQPTEELIAAGVYLGISATICTLLTHGKMRAQRAAFDSTHRLAAANADLEASMRRVVEAQAQLIESEKMAALGQMVASVGHELNAPLGAIHASASNLELAVEHTIAELLPSLSELDDRGRAAFHSLVSDGAATRSTPLSSRELRALRRDLETALATRGIEDPQGVADVLAEIGVPDTSRYAALLDGPRPLERVTQAFDLVALRRNASTIGVAARRATKIVLALKRFSHPGDHSDAPTDAPVTESLDTVLTLYEGKLRGGIELERVFEDPGVLSARHDQLTQVWTNLVHNALQAMGTSGTLSIGVRRIEDRVVVTVSDTGPGVPASVKERLFEPFFTTKLAGEGTGLGLSICREIVTQHAGTIALESSPGRTTFTVSLPSQVTSMDRAAPSRP